MAIQTWVVEIYDDLEATPKSRFGPLDFISATKAVEETLKERTGDTIKVRAPLNAKDEELKALRDLGALIILPPE
ncbi:MAG: hypothetical protein WDN46_21545 [Methylocella sp.]